MNKLYSAKLADPRWKAKRKEILDRDSFTCRSCQATGRLHVHHIHYTGEPWEAPNDDLLTVCPSCHKKIHCGSIKIIEQKLFDGVPIEPIPNTSPPEFDFATIGATEEDTEYLCINGYCDGTYFVVDLRAWGYCP